MLEGASTVIGEQSAAWVRWALGDLVGLLIVVPLVLSYRIPVITPRHPFVKHEAALALLVVIVSSLVVFNIDFPLTYLTVIAILWLGIRFGPRLAAPASLFIVVAGTYFSGQGAGPFVDHKTDAVLQVQGFNLAIAICALVGSSHAVRAWNDQQQLAATVRALPDAVAVRNGDRDMTEQDGRAQKEQLVRDELREARTKEQVRLGRLLHDGAIQELSVATLLIGLAKQTADPKQVELLTEAENRNPLSGRT